MAMPFVAEKDPAAVLDYQFNWAEWLAGDTISASTWTAEEGLTVEDDDFTSVLTTVWLSGGAVGITYAVTNRIVTAGGRTDERTLRLVMVEK